MWFEIEKPQKERDEQGAKANATELRLSSYVAYNVCKLSRPPTNSIHGCAFCSCNLDLDSMTVIQTSLEDSEDVPA